jgi:hypothetical protein
MGHAVQVIAGTVKRINDPDEFTLALFAAFLSQECVIRVIALNFTYNLLFAGPVYLSDIVMPCFLRYGDGNVGWATSISP